MFPTDKLTDATVAAEISGGEEKPQGGGYATNFLKLADEADRLAKRYSTISVRSGWQRAYKAFSNEHFTGSKYLSSGFRGRSKIFRPKTRSAVRKNEASAASALFSTMDTVSISANRADMMSTASSQVMHEIINYRFDRSSGKKGIPWFMIAMGARQDSQIAGMCFSKQHWEYEAKKPIPAQRAQDDDDQGFVSQTGAEEAPGEDGTLHGNDDSDADDMGAGEGVPAPEPQQSDDIGALAANPSDIPAQTPKKPVAKIDRPWMELVPPENVTLDPAAPWYNPVQGGAFLRARWPMHLHEVRGMMKRGSGRMGGGAWKTVDDAVLKAAASEWAARSVRQARDGGRDRMSDDSTNTGDLAIVWVTENFFRWEGEDYHFWSIGEKQYLTEPRPVEEVYPAHKGERPYVGGFGAIEAHKVQPMSPVESWQQLQQEANDVANLRLDNVKQHLSPITKVRRGQQVDLKALRAKGPDATILLNNMDDVQFDRPMDVSGSAYAEMNHLNADFDDLAGSFSSGSVMTNRSLNETVGGMKMLSGSANGMTEYDLRIWVETWVEPAIRQIVQLEQHYEDDEDILSIAGERAELMKKHGLDTITDEMFDKDVLVTVDVGIGSTDPAAQQQKLNAAFQMLGGLAPFYDRPVKVNAEEVMSVVFGFAGHKDGMKFITLGDQPEEGQKGEPSPEEAKATAATQAKQADAQVKQADIQSRQQTAAAQIASSERIAQMNIDAGREQRADDGKLKLLIEALKVDMNRQIDPIEQAMAARLSQPMIRPVQ